MWTYCDFIRPKSLYFTCEQNPHIFWAPLLMCHLSSLQDPRQHGRQHHRTLQQPVGFPHRDVRGVLRPAPGHPHWSMRAGRSRHPPAPLKDIRAQLPVISESTAATTHPISWLLKKQNQRKRDRKDSMRFFLFKKKSNRFFFTFVNTPRLGLYDCFFLKKKNLIL